MQKLWIVVPMYNGAQDVPDFCESLKQCTEQGSYTLVGVDDCSPDNSADLLRTSCPQAIVLRNAKNSGFAGACNTGMRYGIEHGAQYVMLANQDLRFLPNWRDPLISLLDSDASLGAVQPKILMYPDTTLINSCGNELHILGFGYTRGYLKKNSEFFCDGVRDVGYCSGAAVIYRIDVLRRIGLLDEKFFMYHEDSDICWRMQQAGYRTVVSPLSVVAHRYEFSRSIQKFYYIERNRLLMMLKNYQLKTLVLLAPLFLFWECSIVAYSIIGLLSRKNTVIRVKEKIKSYAFFLKPSIWAYIARERKKSAPLRVKQDADIMRHFTCDIAFQDVDSPIIRNVANPITRWYWKCIKRFV
ncbi:MAG: glycosyltransferase family 2 protein [Patescibacteria group bacterium]